MSTLHCALENEANLYVNELKNIQHYRTRSVEERRRRRRKTKKNTKARSTEERREKEECQMAIFYFAWCVRKLRGVYVNCAIIEMLYTHSIVNQP